MIRLFTSGTHNGLSFTNQDIENIARKTADFADEQIPFVLGHPKKNLPIMGFLPKSGIKLYPEGDKVSLGFDQAQADMGDDSMEALRSLGHNKLSVRLLDGVIEHIGLVKRAAVSENNTQDFAELSGSFAADDLLFEDNSNTILTTIQNLFKHNKMDDKEQKQIADISALQSKIDKTSDNVDRLVGLFETQAKSQAKASISNDFSGGDFAHLSDDERRDHADFCASLPAEKQEPYKAMIKALNKKPAAPTNGSVTADFAAKEPTKQSAEDIVRSQISNL